MHTLLAVHPSSLHLHLSCARSKSRQIDRLIDWGDHDSTLIVEATFLLVHLCSKSEQINSDPNSALGSLPYTAPEVLSNTMKHGHQVRNAAACPG